MNDATTKLIIRDELSQSQSREEQKNDCGDIYGICHYIVKTTPKCLLLWLILLHSLYLSIICLIVVLMRFLEQAK